MAPTAAGSFLVIPLKEHPASTANLVMALHLIVTRYDLGVARRGLIIATAATLTCVVMLL